MTLDYASVAQALDGIESTVLLEMGVRGGALPQDELPLRSMLGGALAGTQIDDEGTEPFLMTVLDPSRTLVEKLSALHSAGTRFLEGDATALRRVSRHYTDVDALLGLKRVRDFISGSDYEDLVAEVQALSAGFFPDKHREAPNRRFSESVALAPPDALLDALRLDHEESAPIYFRGAPEFDEVLLRIAAFRDKL